MPIIGNSLEEETEDFAVILSNPKNGELKDKRGVGQILDDDAADLEDVPEISISDRLANEGEKQAVFEVYLDTTSTKEVEVSYATADDTAKAGEDYETIKGTLTFEPGETKEEIVVPIIGNSLEEDTENFIVNLSSSKNGELKKERGVGQILDDDEAIEIDGSEWNASFYEFAGDQPPTDFYLNDSQKLTVQNLGSSENGFNQNWGSGSPSNIPQDKFAIRSYTHADFEEGKTYKARVRADDGYQLLAKHHTLPDNDPNKWVYITSKDEWREDAYGEYQEIEFTVPNSGKYDLHFHYYENTGDAYFDLSWEEKPVDSGSGEDTVTEDRYYSVKEGDTPSGIALNELGDASRWREIIRESTGEQLTDDEIIRPGDLLILPDGSGSGSDDGNDDSNGSDAGGGENSGSENVEDRYYSVKEGDTPSRIALKELGDASRWREIIRESTGKPLTDGEIIKPKDLLILPDGSGSGSDDGNDDSNGSDAGGGENSGSDDSSGGNSNSDGSNSDDSSLKERV